MSFFDDLRNLDRNNVGGWPKSIKVFFALLIVAVILFMGWWFQISVQQEELERAESKEKELKADFVKKQAQVVNLEAYQKQLKDMTDELQQMINQLPGKTEMPKLINEISNAALGAGITNELFQPGAEVMKGFYAEKPIQLRMVGTYHEFGAFISKVASLPRVVILTMHDVSLRPSDGGPSKGKGATPAAGGTLTLEGTVKTYRYMDNDEIAEYEEANAPKPKGRRGAKPAAKGEK
ncbi:type 4a pilus biogenesis protein PilO [Dokdonella immobilis]|uniref:Type IV pilus assembly protein PilO n=1 Tax=Dokdonella immobilis TaxID=578942 RepID=A0A1I5A1X1_9GAMM|nr:type 4a pilus biogenesis protein PilO [Dokdonella immobilis]SFN56398.1 type IV pilus assembly protein PilO [Dokdonella immobilis]